MGHAIISSDIAVEKGTFHSDWFTCQSHVCLEIHWPVNATINWKQNNNKEILDTDIAFQDSERQLVKCNAIKRKEPLVYSNVKNPKQLLAIKGFYTPFLVTSKCKCVGNKYSTLGQLSSISLEYHYFHPPNVNSLINKPSVFTWTTCPSKPVLNFWIFYCRKTYTGVWSQSYPSTFPFTSAHYVT